MICKNISRKKWLLIIIFTICLFGIYNVYKIYQKSPYLFDSSYRKTPPMDVFTSKIANFSMEYPSVLSTHDKPHGDHGDLDIISLLTNEYEYNTIIIYMKKMSYSDENDFLEWGREKGKPVNTEELSYNTYSTNKYKGYLREYKYKNTMFYNKAEKHCYNWFTFRPGYSYNFSLCVEEKFWDLTKDSFLKMINSISFN